VALDRDEYQNIRVLWMRKWTFELHKMRGISWPADDLLAYQEGLRSTRLVICSSYLYDSLLKKGRPIVCFSVFCGDTDMQWLRMGYVQGAVTYCKVLAKNLFQCTEEQRFISLRLANFQAKRQKWGRPDTKSKFYWIQRKWEPNERVVKCR
jgi:hypothetical protein